jgi:hypothetical protein
VIWTILPRGWSRRSFPFQSKDGRHFIQSAGLLAIHPVADALADEFAIFAWRLRAEAAVRFGYDPEGAFGEVPDECGFSGRKCGRVWYRGSGEMAAHANVRQPSAREVQINALEAKLNDLRAMITREK